MSGVFQIPLFTQSRCTKKQKEDNDEANGCGWNDEGLELYNDLCHAIQKDRANAAHSEVFNKALMNVIDNRIKKENSKQKSKKKPKKVVRPTYNDL